MSGIAVNEMFAATRLWGLDAYKVSWKMDSMVWTFGWG